MCEASQFIVDVFAASTSSPIYVSSLRNTDAPESESGERHVLTRNATDVEAFVQKWDRPNRGLFFCVSPLKRGAVTRNKENVAELAGLHADIDFKSIEERPEAVRDVLANLELPPSKIVTSGHGLHCYWHFREALPANKSNIAKVEQLLRMLCRHLSGDPQVCEIARLMRLPGTHNTKGGEWTAVEIIEDRAAARYEFKDLFEWLRDTVPVLTHKPAAIGTANGSTASCGSHDPENPFLNFAAGAGPPIDVEQRLTAMTFQGPGDSSIHATQLSVSASLLSRGHPIDEVVDIIFNATCTAAGAAGNTWNWSKERRDLRKMCEDWLAKHPEIKERQSTEDSEAKNQEGEQQKANQWNWHFHGDPDVQESVAYLVHGLIPEIGTGLLPGQWGIYKTFVALDLAGAVMSGTTFIDFPVVRRGAALFRPARAKTKSRSELRPWSKGDAVPARHPSLGSKGAHHSSNPRTAK
jgi:hypothetical protein